VGDDETEECLMRLQAHSTFGEFSFLCNTPQTYTVRVRELSRVLRLDKQCFKQILENCFSDGRIIVNNLLEVN
jgi:CRP-like cAMP-binding protein